MTAVAARREVVRKLQVRGLSERQALRLVGMSASTLRYQPRDDGNDRLRERLTELAGQHRRHGYRMLHSRLRIDGWAINVKRTYRVYREKASWCASAGVRSCLCLSGSPWYGRCIPTRCGAWTSCSTSWPTAGG